MSQFGLSSANTHWGYGTTGPYSPYLTGSSLTSCTTPTAAQFNNPALGFTCSSSEQATNQDFTGTNMNRDCVPSTFEVIFLLFQSINLFKNFSVARFDGDRLGPALDQSRWNAARLQHESHEPASEQWQQPPGPVQVPQHKRDSRL